MQSVPKEKFLPASATSLVVLPRCPDHDTGTGQRSLLLIDAAARLGPVHVVLLAEGGPVETLKTREGVVSVVIIPNDRTTKGTILGRGLKLLAPARAYAVDPALQAALRQRVAETGATSVLFRYARTYCAAGLEEMPSLDLFVDVDDRDDQKVASRLDRMVGPAFPLKPLGRWQVDKIARVLQTRLNRAQMVWFTAPEDVWAFDRAATGVIANVPHAAPDAPAPVTMASRNILFIGSYAHQPNRDGVDWFLKTCWRHLKDACPDARFRIVGVGNWGRLAEAYGHLDGVEFVGRVDDLAREYADARVAICPVREGGGSKIKVIEAAAFARPVVATEHALRGFDGVVGDTVAAANDPRDFAAAILRYLDDAELARTHGATLRSAQAMYYSRTGAIDRLSGDMSLALAAPNG